ncbi:hypothetical protein [Chitinophaga sp. YIM B06452]|uniref:hypothetical protein n=1 Tax=Chitinophaga sp. YIM B06452 TaxID=3082158 RepID=UPI0031FE8B39
MRLRIVEINFTARHDWLFKLCNEAGNEFYVMNEVFYKCHYLRSPIMKRELDQYDKGQWITAFVESIGGKGIVVKV